MERRDLLSEATISLQQALDIVQQLADEEQAAKDDQLDHKYELADPDKKIRDYDWV